MPKHFNINRRPLTHEEKFERVVDYLTYESPYVVEKFYIEDSSYELDYKKIYENLNSEDKKYADEFLAKEVFDETITLKCLKCGYEETTDWEIVDECWMRSFAPEYPTSHCLKCNKPSFVPIDIYNKKKRIS